MIYLDHAATTPLHPAAKTAMAEAMEVVGNPSSLHGAGRCAKALLEESRKAIADCLGCEPTEILFTSGGTESNALALHGKNRVLTSPMEHPSLVKNCKQPLFFPVKDTGIVDDCDLEAFLRQGVDLVSLQYANSETGLLQPVARVGEVCRRYGVPFHSDGVQAVGKAELCLRKLPVDLLSFSAHKFGGPAGIGGLYRKEGTPLLPLYQGGKQEREIRPGTESVLLACGMAAALQAAVQERVETAKRLSELGEQILRKVISLGGVETGRGKRIPGHLHFRFPGKDGEALAARLDLLGFCVSAGAACHSGSHTPSPVLLAMGFSEKEASEGLRVTLGQTTQREDVQAFLAALEGIKD